MYNLADIVSTGYQTGAKIGQDITAGNILQEAYKGVDAADPQAAVTINQKAAQLAGMTGNASLAHTFQKEASEVGKGAAEQQLNQLKTTQGKLELASQFAGAANNEDDLRKAYQVAGVGTQEAQIMEGILRNPNVPFERKKEEFKRMGLTANQDIQAQLKVLQGQLNERKVEVLEQGLLLRERKAAQGQGNIKGSPEAPLGAIKRQSATLKDELGDIQVKDASGNLVPMSDAQRATVASRIENEGRQRYKNNPQDYASRQDAVDEARDDIISQDFGTTRTKSTFAGIEVPFTGKDETVYKPKEAAKPTAKKATKGAYSADQTAWIDRAMKANPDMSREEIISEGKKLKKL